MLVTILVIFPIICSAKNIKSFLVKSDKGPISDGVCLEYGGTPLGLNSKRMKNIVKKSSSVGRIMYKNNYAYVIYGSHNNSILPTQSLNLCRFSK